VSVGDDLAASRSAVESGGGGSRDREASEDLRPAVDVRKQRARGGVSVFELARIRGMSVAMIERSYGTLIEGAGADIARRLDDFEALRNRSGDEVATGGD
jgi:hypothetical protein